MNKQNISESNVSQPASSRLQIERRSIPYVINGKSNTCEQSEFIVDGQPLSTVFGFAGSRPWFGMTFLDSVKTAKENQLQGFLGLCVPFNQFGSGRFVLYRCHCGSDYCGVISCELNVEGDRVCWRDIRYETDPEEAEDTDDDDDLISHVISDLYFDLAQYRASVNDFIAALDSGDGASTT